MADQVRMTANTTFANDRITVFPEGGPDEGVKGVAVTTGQEFETDPWHARDLKQLGRADPVNAADLDGELPPLEPHHQVSVPALTADQAARAKRKLVPTPAETPLVPAPAAGAAPAAAAVNALGGAVKPAAVPPVAAKKSA